MNVRLLRRIQKHILAEPRRYNQNVYLDQHPPRTKDDPPCGTMGCIAGWAVKLSGEPISGSVQTAAMRLVGLDEDQAERLFCGIDEDQAERPFCGIDYYAPTDPRYSWPAKFVKRYYSAKTARGRARAGADRIEHFIKTKGAE